MEQAKATQRALDENGARAVEANRAVEALADPVVRTRARAMLKTATGNEGKLTAPERDAVAGSRTREGLPYFERADGGKARLTEAGRAELAREHPEIAKLLDAHNGGGLAGRSGLRASGDPGSAAPSRSPEMNAPGSSRGIGPTGRSMPVTREDVHAAATAPDARKRLGDVRADTLHALEAYRFPGDKQRKMGRLSPEEQVKYERASQALAEAVGKEARESLASSEWLQGPSRPEKVTEGGFDHKGLLV